MVIFGGDNKNSRHSENESDLFLVVVEGTSENAKVFNRANNWGKRSNDP